MLCRRGVALQLLNSFVGDQTFHTEPGYSDGNEDKPEHHGAAADNCSRLGGAHSVLLQGPDWTSTTGDLATDVREAVRSVRARFRAVSPADYEAIALEDFNAWLDLVAEWLASRPTKDPPTDDKDMSLHARGYRAFSDDTKRDLTKRRLDCSSCHSYKKEGGGIAPDLTGYGDADWVRLMIMAPGDQLRHGKNNVMPAFRNDDGPGAEVYMLEFRKDQPDLPVVPLSGTVVWPLLAPAESGPAAGGEPSSPRPATPGPTSPT